MRRRPLLLPLLLACSLAPLVAERGPAAAQPAGARPGGDASGPFSRSRWLREHKARLGMDESRHPTLGHRKAPRGPVAPAPLPAARGLRNVRVSLDILGDAAPGQQETQTEPHLAIDPERETTLLAAYQEGRFESGGARTLTYAWSADGGRRWHEGRLPGLTRDLGGAYERVSDPWVAFGPDQRAYYVSLAFDETSPANGIYVSASTDGGRSWGAPVAVHTNATVDLFDDKESIVVDTRADSPFRGRVYVGWDTVTDDRQVLRIAHSADGGESWSAPAALVDRAGVGNVGVIMAIGPGGSVHAVWTLWEPSGPNEARTTLLTSRSDDGGVSWSAPQPIAPLLAAGVPGMRTGDVLPSLAADPRNGILYVTWQDARFTGTVDQVLLARSTDGGFGWSEPRRVSDGPADAAAFTPAVAVNGRGWVGVSYSSLRHDPNRNQWVDQYIAFSKNGGRTFGASRRVTARSFPAADAAFSRGWFLGDYQGLVAGKVVFRPLFVGTLLPSARVPGRRQPDAFSATVRP
jgi:hypothetical protein